MEAYHTLEYFPGSFSPFRVAEEYTKTARKFNVQLPDMIDRYMDTSREIEKTLYACEPLIPRPCHNDLLNRNFIDDGNRLCILSWEYAGMGDIFFDLGNFAIQHEFNDQHDEMLLRTYFNNPTNSQRAHQKLMKIMSDLREAMWALIQIGISKLDFDYAGYGQKYLSALRQVQLPANMPVGWEQSDNPQNIALSNCSRKETCSPAVELREILNGHSNSE